MHCETCGKPLTRGSRGPVRRFCDDSCRKRAPRVLRLPAGVGTMTRAAERLAAEAGERRTLDAVDEAILAALRAAALALDAQPSNASLMQVWRGLLGDLQAVAPGQQERDLSEILGDYRAKLREPRGGAA
jgi:hypothetical protein